MIQTTPKAQPRVNRWLTAISVMAGTFMVIIDSTVVNVSLEYIAGSLFATDEEATWAMTTYLAANAIILPLTCWLADLKLVLAVGLLYHYTNRTHGNSHDLAVRL